MVGRQLFAPFGGVRAEYGEMDGSWGWATHRKAETTGLTFMRARWYAPGVGRFVQPDSIVPWAFLHFTGRNFHARSPDTQLFFRCYKV